jgi:5-methylcytosine-specific restriction enzyme A
MGRLAQTTARLARPAGRLAPPAKTVDPFYESAEWRGFVRLIKRQRGYVCEACHKDCTATPRGLIGDHIVERRDGGADFDPLNVRLLCTGCHNRKTAAARGARPDPWRG